jgi:hypothetical protein
MAIYLYPFVFVSLALRSYDHFHVFLYVECIAGGVVFRSKMRGGDVAVKVLGQGSPSKAQLKAMKNEAMKLQEMGWHANIVTLRYAASA